MTPSCQLRLCLVDCASDSPAFAFRPSVMSVHFALLALCAFASAAPHALAPAELVANGLVWTPSMEGANNESAWSELARRQFKVNTCVRSPLSSLTVQPLVRCQSQATLQR